MPATIPTFDELYNAAKAETQARQPSLTDYSDGSALDAITGGGAVLADMQIRADLDAAAAKYIAIATGSDLDAAVTDIFPGCPRQAESASVGTLTFTRGGSSGVVEILAGTVVTATVNGQTVTFTTDSSVYLTGTTVDAIAHCSTTGTVGNVAAGVVTTIPMPIPDDTTATVTNADRFVGGAATETDDAYRARAQAYPLTLRRGTVAALEEGALSVAGVSYVTVDESLLSTDATVYVYVGDPDGRGNAALASLVATELENWRAAGVLVVVDPAAREEVSVGVAVAVKTGAGTDALKASIRAAVLAYTNSLPAGGQMYLSTLESAAIRVSSDVLGAIAIITGATPTTDGVVPSVPQNALRVLSSALQVVYQ